jgi:prepilin-type processing-associated H-X9-DG protein
LILILVLPSRQESVHARALDALGGGDTVLHLREEVFARVPGVYGTTTRDVWFDAANGRTRWADFGADGTAIAETLVTPGRFDRVLTNQGVHLYGRTCRAVVFGCAQVLDPVARYREMLRTSTARPVRTTFAGRKTYRFELPLQRGLDQLVYVDVDTLLPRTIIWRERGANGDVHVVSTIDVTDVERVSREDAPTRIFERPRGGRLVRILPAGRLLRVAPRKRGEVRGAFWLGPHGLRSVEARRYQNGTTIVVRYPDFEVWTYRAVPRELLASRLGETKTIDVGGRPATFAFLDGHVALVRDGVPSVAVVGVTSKEALFDALSEVRPLR